MVDLRQFRETVTIYRKRQIDPATERPYTLDALARSIGLSADELGHRLRGTGRSKLTSGNVLAIVRTLAEWDTLTWEEAVALLICIEYPLDPPNWQTDLQRFLGPVPRSVHQTITSQAALKGQEPSSPVRRRLFQVRDLPKEYVPRPNALNQIKRLLLAHEENQKATAITMALRGAGGFGKTTLALALCHDQQVQAAFPDGILWVELGEHPSGSLAVLNELLHVLEPSEREALTLEEGRERWQRALEGRAYLLVIDDVWQREVLEELIKEGSRCGRLITTRNDQILPNTAKRVWVDAMEPDEAMELLCEGVIDDWQHTLDQSVLEEVVIQQLGCWPLLVSLARGMLANQVGRLHKAPKQALALLKQAYEERGTATFYLRDRDERQRNINACVEVNLHQLEEGVPAHYQTRQRYLELAVFPEDTDIPLSTLQIYWQETGGLYDWEVEDLCLHMADLSLLLPWDTTQQTIRMHDVLRSYLIQHTGEQLHTFHESLLQAFQQHYHLARWADLPQSETYLWQRLVFHLRQAGDQETLQHLFTDLLYLTRKVMYVGVSELEADLALALAPSPCGEEERSLQTIEQLHQTIRLSSHLLRQAASEAEVGGLLLSHLPDDVGWNHQRRALEQSLPRPFFTTWHPLPHHSSSALLRTLRGHTGSLYDCEFSPDGGWIVSASDDKTLKVREAATGAEIRTLSGHTDRVLACGFSPDGTKIISASWDGTLKVWDSTTGAERLTLFGHNAPVYACGFSPDGTKIISASADKTLKVWDSATGAEVLTLPGHRGEVLACGFNSDGRWIVSASADGTLKVWEAATGAEHRTLSGHTNWVFACRFSPDGRWIVSASADDMLKVWEAATGAEIRTISGHNASVHGCEFSPDGRWIVSASDDKTLKVWEVATGAEIRTLSGHNALIYACRFSPDGTKIVSASDD